MAKPGADSQATPVALAQRRDRGARGTLSAEIRAEHPQRVGDLPDAGGVGQQVANRHRAEFGVGGDQTIGAQVVTDWRVEIHQPAFPQLYHRDRGERFRDRSDPGGALIQLPGNNQLPDDGSMRLWTLQAPEVISALQSRGVYRADWDLVTPNWRSAFRDMAAEMRRRGIECHGAPPIWCWPGRTWRRSAVRSTANLLLGDHEWAHGRWLVELHVPEALTMPTSYAVWNDYLCYTMGFDDGPEHMDWSGTLVWERDRLQVTIPELRREWVVRAKPYPPDAETAARIAADPLLVPHRSQIKAPTWAWPPVQVIGRDSAESTGFWGCHTGGTSTEV